MPSTTERSDAVDQYHRDGWDELSDAGLAAAVARCVSVPRRDPADSFVLHAPLEVLARVALLPEVRPEDRERARQRILAVAVAFDAAGPPVDDAPVGSIAADRFDSVGDAAGYLRSAIGGGDLDAVDDAARWLGRVADPSELRAALAADVVPRLAAAGHGSILLYQLPRVAPRRQLTGELLRGLARELAREPTWRIGWIDDDPPPGGDDVVGRLARTVDQGRGGSTFIRPTMDRVDSTGIAAEVVGRVTWDDADPLGPALLRVAARSMLLDRSEAAPYGWTHCLTLPQSVLGVASATGDASQALRVAATHVLGFRASLGDVPVDGPVELADPGIPVEEALAVGPAEAAGAVLHSCAAPAELGGLLASRASVRHDAHQVKYTLACLDAAAADPSHARLYLCAAASLVGWWSRHGDPSDPLASRMGSTP